MSIAACTFLHCRLIGLHAVEIDDKRGYGNSQLNSRLGLLLACLSAIPQKSQVDIDVYRSTFVFDCALPFSQVFVQFTGFPEIGREYNALACQQVSSHLEDSVKLSGRQDKSKTDLEHLHVSRNDLTVSVSEVNRAAYYCPSG